MRAGKRGMLALLLAGFLGISTGFQAVADDEGTVTEAEQTSELAKDSSAAEEYEPEAAASEETETAADTTESQSESQTETQSEPSSAETEEPAETAPAISENEDETSDPETGESGTIAEEAEEVAESEPKYTLKDDGLTIECEDDPGDAVLSRDDDPDLEMAQTLESLNKKQIVNAIGWTVDPAVKGPLKLIFDDSLFDGDDYEDLRILTTDEEGIHQVATEQDIKNEDGAWVAEINPASVSSVLLVAVRTQTEEEQEEAADEGIDPQAVGGPFPAYFYVIDSSRVNSGSSTTNTVGHWQLNKRDFWVGFGVGSVEGPTLPEPNLSIPTAAGGYQVINYLAQNITLNLPVEADQSQYMADPAVFNQNYGFADGYIKSRWDGEDYTYGGEGVGPPSDAGKYAVQWTDVLMVGKNALITGNNKFFNPDIWNNQDAYYRVNGILYRSNVDFWTVTWKTLEPGAVDFTDAVIEQKAKLTQYNQLYPPDTLTVNALPKALKIHTNLKIARSPVIYRTSGYFHFHLKGECHFLTFPLYLSCNTQRKEKNHDSHHWYYALSDF